ncbi:MAG: hypothetical protein ACRETY_12275 [Steroidobacteraceae bacterium]
MSRARPCSHREALRVAIGVAVPAIEAWYLFGKDPRASEASWAVTRTGDTFLTVKRALKKAVYGSEVPLGELLSVRAAAEATRISSDLAALARFFPGGFAPLAEEVGAWRERGQ